MFDLMRSYESDKKERSVASGANITEEGQFLVYVSDGAGGLAVQPSAGVANEKPAGFAITDSLKAGTMTAVETVTVPSTAPYTVNLGHGTITTGQVRAVGSTTGALTRDDASADAGEFGVNSANGVLTFNAAQAGETVTVTYRYNMTVAQALAANYSRHLASQAQDAFSLVSVMCGEGEIFTTVFDAAASYSVGQAVWPGANGTVTTTRNGQAFPIGSVTEVPSANNSGMLGVKFNMIPTVGNSAAPAV